MENCNNNNPRVGSRPYMTQASAGTTFEYSLPMHEDDDYDEVGSNKSTPYYTPMEYMHNTFDFPSPKLEKVPQSAEEDNASSADPVNDGPAPSGDVQMTSPPTDENNGIQKVVSVSMKSFSPSAGGKQAQPSSSPPVVNRKLRRFSLYERRSCSPQRLLIKNTTSLDISSGCSMETEMIVADKENTKPNEEDNAHILVLANTGNSSPSADLMDETTSSPRVLSASEAARLTYSPKLLASINNLNLSSGSPLGVINSAGYKNGNYFKFPEIDHVVQDNGSGGGGGDTQLEVDKRSGRTGSGEERKCLSSETTNSSAKNRKNKNNLTIRIADAVTPPEVMHIPPSPKPKTPTIKNTEKALSLDSAAQKAELSVFVAQQKQETGVSYDEIDSESFRLPQLKPLKHRGPKNASSEAAATRGVCATSNRSTSMSQLSAYTTYPLKPLSSSQSSQPLAEGSGGVVRTPRRRVSGTPAGEWLQYHRKQHPFHGSGSGGDGPKKSVSADSESASARYEDDSDRHTQSVPTTATSLMAAATTHRGIHKLNASHMHTSNTNLKTLPEFLTLVEFSTGGGGGTGKDHPYKQKSMDLPTSTIGPSTSAIAAAPIVSRPKPTAMNSTVSLLERRGSNHSLTLNLHGSCGNLLGSCRSGLSVSNYSLGSVANSTNNLNSKSMDMGSGHPAVASHLGGQLTAASLVATCAATTQVEKQSLYRRRSSNRSLTLTNLTATSCGNLNSFASQNSLNVAQAQSGGIPRTTSFITPTHATPASITPKRGLLERRGSNQSLTINMSSSFGGIGCDRNSLAAGHSCLGMSSGVCAEGTSTEAKAPLHVVQSHHQRKFFSSENLNKGSTSFSDLNQAHRRDANQVCYGSISDLKPGELEALHSSQGGGVGVGFGGGVGGPRRDPLDFQEGTVCTCSGVRNIITRPLSPQATSEEFKVYLANIQMLQNASNALSQTDLIKLNHIFDNSYASNSQNIVPVLNLHNNGGGGSGSGPSSKDPESPPGLAITSEDCELSQRYEQAVRFMHETLSQLNDDEQKRMFRDLHKEFWELPLNHQEKPMVFGSQAKNRYKTILPNENSRVILDKERKQLNTLLGDPMDCNVEMTRQMTIHDEGPPYINANYIKGPDYTSKCYVATQGPLPNTIFEFWLMVYQNTEKHFEGPTAEELSQHHRQHQAQYHQKIVMLTNIMENNRQKCSVYFPIELNEIFVTTGRQEVVEPSPALNAYFEKFLTTSPLPSTTGIETLRADLDPELHSILPVTANIFVVKNVGIVRKNGFSIRRFAVLYCINAPSSSSDRHSLIVKKFYCYHYWYPDWPDHRSPRDINTLVDICVHILNLGKCETEFEAFSDSSDDPKYLQRHIDAQRVDQYQEDLFNCVQPMPVVHCSAGIGRTGCLTAILNGIRQLRQSLAYSLTSMAAAARTTTVAANAAVSKEEDTSISASATQVFSPIDFCLPKDFQSSQEVQQRANRALISDTDSSFTRNTLLYVLYVLQKQQKDSSAAGGSGGGGDSDGDGCCSSETLPSIADLPHVPDIFVDILGIVCNLRLQRGGMVQNSEQYELIHRAICLYLKRTFALKRF